MLKVLPLDLSQSNNFIFFCLLSLLVTKEEVKALFDFDAREEDELTLKIGDIVNVHKKLDDNWWIGQVGDRVGSFPTNYVEQVTEGLL